MIITQSPTAAVSYYTTSSESYVQRELPLGREHGITIRTTIRQTPVVHERHAPQTSSVRMVGQEGSPGAVRVQGAGAVDRREAEAAANDEGVPLRAGVERRKGVADRLHCWGRQGRALADVEVRKPIFHRVPPPALALHSAVREGVHGTVRDVLAEVEA
jgi:hypothetical protein